MVKFNDENQLQEASTHSEWLSTLYLSGTLLLTGGSLITVQRNPEILLNNMILGTLCTLFVIFSALGLYLSKKLLS